MSYLRKQLFSAPVESELTGGWKDWLVVGLVRGVRVCVLEKFEHGVVFIHMLFGNQFVVAMKDHNRFDIWRS